MARSRVILAIGVIAAVSAPVSAQTPLGTAFTYQGRLNEGGAPAEGTYDLRFKLYTAATLGSQVAVDCVDGVTPVDGLFTVELDFGAAAFAGDARWIEIDARIDATPANCSSGPYTRLTPRQPLTAAPYALFALSGPGQAGFWVANGLNISNSNSGNVGIGTTTPAAKLDIKRSFNETAPAVSVRQFTTSSAYTSLAINGASIDSGGNAISDNPLRLNPTTDSSVLLAGGGGKVGIGTTTPRQQLSIGANLDLYSGAANSPTRPSVRGSNLDNLVLSPSDAGALYLNYDGGTGGVRFHNGTSGGEVMRVSSTGTVSIGTTNANGRLTIDSPDDTAIYATSFDNTGPVASFSSGLNPNFSGNVVSAITGGTTGRAGYFSNVNSNNSNAALYCKTSGSGPALWADGVARVEVLEITGADVAERFPTTGEHDAIKPGMVMEIDPEVTGKLRIARGAYNHRVAGVVSGAGEIPTGTILGNLPGAGDAPPIALSGRVYVYCDSSSSAIEPGDLLTTSDTAGHAMKVSDSSRAQGAILGKAMSSLSRGERGLVLVLVTLQ